MDMASVFETEIMLVRSQPGVLKTCSKCKLGKSIETDFATKRGKPQSQCRACMKLASDAHYQANKAKVKARSKARNEKIRDEIRLWLWGYLSLNPCVDCGEDDPVVLEFDHRDRELKTGSVSKMISNHASISQIQNEVVKCDVRCVLCHRRKTAREGNWWKLTFGM
jgi:hypothetical protein